MTTRLVSTVLLALEHRFEGTPDGHIWTASAYPYEYFLKYLAGETELLVAARVKQVSEPSAGARRADGPRVRFTPLTDYSGLLGFARAASVNKGRMAEALGASDAVLLKVPSLISTSLWLQLLARRRPYGVEVVGDPDQVFARGAITHPLRVVLRRCARVLQRSQCRRATTALYVTREYLQQRYPCPGASTAASDVELPREWFDAPPVRSRSAHRLIGIGSLERPYKGVDTLLFAMAQCRAAGVELSLTWLGDGRLRRPLEELAGQLGVGSQVKFVGTVPAASVREYLDAADLFVLPSRTEGMPRALLEAQARGLPCIASRVGGVPEHTHPAALVEPAVAHKLARRLTRFVQDERFRRTLIDYSLAAREELRKADRVLARKRAVEDLCWQSSNRNRYDIGGAISLVVHPSYRWRRQLRHVLADALSRAGDVERPLRIDLEGLESTAVCPSALRDRAYGVEAESTPAGLRMRTRGPGLEWLMWLTQVLLLRQGRTFVHGAGIEIAGRVYVIAAAGGTGKTAAVTSLLNAAGSRARLMGDDMVVVDRSGRSFAFCKAMALYDYHRTLPALRAGAPSLPSRVLEATRPLKDFLRRWPEALGFARTWNPFVRWQAPRAVFGLDKLAREGQLAGVVWLQRADVEGPERHAASSDFADRLAQMTLSEFDRFVLDRWKSESSAAEWTHVDVWAEAGAILADAVAAVPCVHLTVPMGFTPAQIADAIMETVQPAESGRKAALAPVTSGVPRLRLGA